MIAAICIVMAAALFVSGSTLTLLLWRHAFGTHCPVKAGVLLSLGWLTLLGGTFGGLYVAVVGFGIPA